MEESQTGFCQVAMPVIQYGEGTTAQRSGGHTVLLAHHCCDGNGGFCDVIEIVNVFGT